MILFAGGFFGFCLDVSIQQHNTFNVLKWNCYVLILRISDHFMTQQTAMNKSEINNNHTHTHTNDIYSNFFSL